MPRANRRGRADVTLDELLAALETRRNALTDAIRKLVLIEALDIVEADHDRGVYRLRLALAFRLGAQPGPGATSASVCARRGSGV